MRKIKKICAVALIAAMCLTLTACEFSFGQKIPDSTSEDWGLYTMQRNGMNTIVDSDGQLSFDYSFDKKGNAIDKNRTIVVGKDNLSEFVSIQKVETDESVFSEMELDTKIIGSGTGVAGTAPVVNEEEPIETTVSASFAIVPAFATCNKIKVESSNPDTVEVSGAGTDGIAVITTDDKGSGKFDLVYKKDGAVSLIISSVDGNYEKNYNIHVILNDTPINADEFKHEMTPLGSTTASAQMTTEPQSNAIITKPTVSQQETVVAVSSIQTTENTQGWINGSKVNLREEPSTSSNVIDTYATGKSLTILGNANGWSKVQVDGQTGYLKTVYVTTVNPNQTAATNTGAATSDRITGSTGTVVYGQQTAGSTNYNNSSAYYRNGATYSNTSATGSNGTASTPVNAPIASNDGMDHGYAFSSPASPVGNDSHAHDFKVAESVAPSGSESGYTLYKCSCGTSYKGPYTASSSPVGPTHTHSYSGTTVAPTCTEIGYTAHICTSCGDEYRDSFVPATGHSFSTEELTDGTIRHICDTCGYFFDEVPE